MLFMLSQSSSSTSTPATNDSSPTTPDEDTKKEDVQQGYLKRAVSGLTNGVYSVGKWLLKCFSIKFSLCAFHH